MTGSDEPSVAHPRSKDRVAPSLFLRPIIAFACLLMVVGAGTALADDTPASSDLPLGLLQEVVESPEAEPQLTDPLAAEELPHQNLGREEAVELTEAVFEPVLQNAAGPNQDLEVESYLSDTAAIVPASAEGEEGVADAESVLLESTLPLRTDGTDGPQVPVDLDLDASGDSIEPQSPLVEVELPKQLGEGIFLPETGIGIALSGAPADRTPSMIEEAVATYPNVATDTDFSVAPTPTGVETFTTLRSADSPRSQTFHLDLPASATLNQDQEGAEVTRGGDTILKVLPPSAIDADGAAVPVALSVSGDSFTLKTSPTEDSKFPILVDPIIESYDWYDYKVTTGQNTWHPQNSVWGLIPATNNEGLFIQGNAGHYSPGDQAGWYYWVPRLKEEEAAGRTPTSFIVRMDLWHLSFVTGSGPYSPYMSAGILGKSGWAGKLGQPPAVWGYGGNGAAFPMNPGKTVILNNGEPGKRDESAKVGLGLGLSSTEDVWTTTARQVGLGAATVEVADDEKPNSANGSISPWVNQSATTAITADAADTGLGVKHVGFEIPGQGLKLASHSCDGTVNNPCPFSWKASIAANQYNPAQMPQGFDWIPITVEDIVHNQATLGATKALVKVDHTAPGLNLSGSLTEQATTGTSASQYTLNYVAGDGDFATPTALAPFGTAGTGVGKMQLPMGVALDATGNAFVVDRTCKCVQKYDSAGKFLSQFGTPGTGNGQFSEPNGIAISSVGNILVSDSGNKNIQIFDSSGGFIRKVAYSGFMTPYAIAASPGNAFWVSDVSADKVFAFRESDGGYLGTAYGSPSNPGGAATGLSSPAALAVDTASGTLWVGDNALNRVTAFSNATGGYSRHFGSEGSGDGQFKGPVGIAVAPSGHILVADDLNNRVQVFQPTGQYLRQFGTLGAANNQFSRPQGLVVGPGNVVYVADAFNKRIARWTHADYDPQSGIAKVEVKVDGQLKATPYNTACATNSCPASGEWTYKASDYSTGQHKVDVITTDGVNLPTTKSVTVSSINDVTPPQLSASVAFFTAPEGWLEQREYALKASATDAGGSGLASMVLKIDGQVVKSVSQTCPNGGCGQNLGSGTINVATYKGGAHPAELVATDGVGLVTKKAWTMNVDPSGVIPAEEATDTLEALEETAEEMQPVAPTHEFLEPEIIQAGDNPGLQIDGNLLNSTGTPASTSINRNTEAVTITGTEGPVEITPVGEGSPMSADIEAGVAAVTPSTAPGVDTVIRPEYNGALFFTDIRSPSSTDAFTWHVSLQPGQTLKAIDDQAAQVIFEDGTSMALITAMPAHDATGAEVPTNLEVSGANVTLKVSHKAKSYIYPVMAGHSFEVGYSSVIVIDPAIVEEELQEEGTPFRNPFPPSVGDSLTVGEMLRLMSAPRGTSYVPPPTASVSAIREFELNESKCHPDTCAAYEVHQWGPHFVRYTESVEWAYVNPADPHREDLHCEGDIDFPFILSTKIDVVNAGRTERWSAKKGSGKHLATWCHFELDVWASPHDFENFPGIPDGTASRSMQVWVYPNGYQNYHMFPWKGVPGPDEA